MPRKYIPVAQRRASGDLPPITAARSKAAQAAQNVRWALVEANKTAIVDYVNSIPTSESLPLLQLMRDNVQAAAEAIERKIQSSRKETCVYCGGPQKGRGWRMETNRTDPITLRPRTVKVCSDLCLSLWMQQQHGGIAALPDRGGKFGPDKPLKEPGRPSNGEAPNAGSSEIRETSN